MFTAKAFFPKLILPPSAPASDTMQSVDGTLAGWHNVSKTLSGVQDRRFRLLVLGEKEDSDFDFIFPDQDDLPLTLENVSVDHDKYETQFSSLSATQHRILEGLTGTTYDYRVQGLIYSELSTIATAGFNFAINTKLAQRTRLCTGDAMTVCHLISALKTLPTASGEFACVVEHSSAYPYPWGKTVHINDVVSCRPCFLPAFSTLAPARQTFGDHGLLNPRLTDAVVMFKIHVPAGLNAAVPLLKGVITAPEFDGKDLILFQESACFRVDGIATAEPAQDVVRAGNNPVRRVGVILTQIASQDTHVKDMFTGMDSPSESFR